MVQFMRDSGKTTKLMEMEDSFMLTEMFILENGLMIKLMVKVSTFILMEQDMMANGSMISNKERAENHGQMVPYSKATT